MIATLFLGMKQAIKGLPYDTVHVPSPMRRQNAISPTQEERDETARLNYAFQFGERLYNIRLDCWPTELSMDNKAWEQCVELEREAYNMLLQSLNSNDGQNMEDKKRLAFTQTVVWLDEKFTQAAASAGEDQ